MTGAAIWLTDMDRPMRASYLALVMTVMVETAAAHDWFEGLRSPSRGLCCDQDDCRQVPYRFNAVTGLEEVQVYGRWWPVDPLKVAPAVAPDGKVYARWSAYPRTPSHPPAKIPRFRCIILPRMTSLEAPTVG